MAGTPFKITKFGIVGNLTGSVQGTASYALEAPWEGIVGGTAALTTLSNDLKTYVGSNYVTASLGVVSETIRTLTEITSASYSAIPSPDPETLYFITDEEGLKKPVTIFETDGTSGLLGINSSSLDTGSWQLQNLNLSPYKYLKCYFKAAVSSVGSDQWTPAVVVEVPLDEASAETNYYGSTMVFLPFNRNRQYGVCVVVDPTKTKLQVLYQITLWDISVSNANSGERYLYKVVGYFD